MSTELEIERRCAESHLSCLLGQVHKAEDRIKNVERLISLYESFCDRVCYRDATLLAERCGECINAHVRYGDVNGQDFYYCDILACNPLTKTHRYDLSNIKPSSVNKNMVCDRFATGGPTNRTSK